MRHCLAIALAAAALASPLHAADPLADCKAFLEAFDQCIARLEGEQKEEAQVFLRTTRGMLGMNDEINRGDPTLTGMMCSGMMDEIKKDPDIQRYNCAW